MLIKTNSSEKHSLYFIPKNLFRLTLSTRLSLGFGLVGLGVIGILIASLLGLSKISFGLDSMIGQAMPLKDTLAKTRLTLETISTGAAEHYNSRDTNSMQAVEADVEKAVELFGEYANLLLNAYKPAENSESLKLAVEQAQNQFELIAWNMNTHRRSIQAETRISEIRAQLIKLRSETSPIFNQYIYEITAPEARTLAFRLQALFDNAALMGVNVSLADSLETIESAQAELRNSLDTLASLTFKIMDQSAADTAFASYYQSIEPTFERLKQLVTSNNGLISQQKNIFVEIRSILPTKIASVQDRLAISSESFSKLSNEVDRNVATISKETTSRVELSKSILWGATLGILLLCVIVSVLVVLSVRQPIGRLRDYMKQVGSGDFTVPVGNYRNDEIGEVFQSTEQLVGAIKAMIRRIADLNLEINLISNDSAQATNSAKLTLHGQSENLNSVATATTQMSYSIKEVAENSRMAADEMLQSKAQAHEVESTVDNTVSSTNQLKVTMNQAVEVIKSLDSEVAGIEEILEVIQNIAGQTNLLALNAAIEAARAGEQGRGFAVVADEVRTLASRTQQSTEEIRQKINTIMSGSHEAVTSISESLDSVRGVTECVSSIEKSFADHMTHIAKVNDLNTQISTATKEQHVTSEEMSRWTIDINNRVSEVVINFDTTAQQASRLNEIAKNLDDAISQIRL
ncbi:MAG: methyl-accepting chemotaxis protein [Amphritea sp.]